VDEFEFGEGELADDDPEVVAAMIRLGEVRACELDVAEFTALGMGR
jgi:hypothetical protein